jgi:hypothetical protein
MLRRLFSPLAASSLVLCLATAALWVRSYRAEDAVSVYYDPLFGEGNGLLTASDAGRIYGQYGMDASTIPHPRPGMNYSSTTAIPYLTTLTARHRLLGFAAGRGNPAINFWGITWARFAIVVPHYGLCLLFAAPPAVYAWRVVRSRRRQARGAFPVCGTGDHP